MKFRDEKWREWINVGSAVASCQPVGSQFTANGRIGVVISTTQYPPQLEIEFTKKVLVRDDRQGVLNPEKDNRIGRSVRSGMLAGREEGRMVSTQSRVVGNRSR